VHGTYLARANASLPTLRPCAAAANRTIFDDPYYLVVAVVKKYSEPVLEIPFGAASEDEKVRSISFFSFDEVIEWIDGETKFWTEQLGNMDRQNRQPYQAVKQTLFDPLANLRTYADQAKKFADGDPLVAMTDPGIAQPMKNLGSVATHYAAGQALFSDSQRARYIAELPDQNIRLHTYAAFTGHPSANNEFALQGMLEHHRYLHEPVESIASVRLAFEELQDEYTAKLSGLRKEFPAVLDAIVQDREGFEEDHRSSLSDAKDALARLDKKYRTEIASRTAVEYWGTKKVGHQRFAGFFAFLVAIWFGLGIYALKGQLSGLSNPESTSLLSGVAGAVGNDAIPGALLVALGGLLVIIYLWVSRLLVRFLLSNSHLATDAAERQMATKVFLALMDDDSAGVEAEDRKFVLENIFRPTQLGMIKEESAPPSLLGSLTRRLDQ
jgi:hypothetical protein